MNSRPGVTATTDRKNKILRGLGLVLYSIVGADLASKTWFRVSLCIIYDFRM